MRPNLPLILFAAALVVMSPGCASTDRTDAPAPVPSVVSRVTYDDPRALPMFAGDDGSPIGWDEVLTAASSARVVIVGEIHDDTRGHDVELALAQDLLSRCPRGAVSLEFLERDQQVAVDDYLDGLIDTPALFDRLGIKGDDRRAEWERSYLRLINAGRDARVPVIAANTPRRYVRLARTEGYEHLDAFTALRRDLFDLPSVAERSAYRDRFFDIMREAADAEAASGASTNHGMDPDASFRSQRVWDATMAQSIVNAVRAGRRPVLHVVGGFHIDFNGGTVQETCKRLGVDLDSNHVLTISMQQRDAASLDPEDRRRADVIIYTGPRPPDPEPEPEAPASQPESMPSETQPELPN